MRAQAAVAAVLIVAMSVWHTGADATEYEGPNDLPTDMFRSVNSAVEAKILDWLRDGGDPNLVLDGAGDTFTHYAATNLLSILREALLRGGEPNRENKFGATPLHFSASQDGLGPGPEAIKLLLLAGAEIDRQDRRGNTPLHAVHEGVENPAPAVIRHLGTAPAPGRQGDVLKALLEQGRANPNIKNDNGDTPLIILIRTKAPVPDRLDQVSILLRNGADANTRNNTGRTVLIEAILRTDNSRYGLPWVTKLIDLLLGHGADPNLRHANGDTPLIVAAKHGDDIGKEMEALLRGGADPCLTDRSGKLAYDYTEKGSDGRRVLHKAGGNPEASDSKCGGGEEQEPSLSQDQRKRIQSCLKTQGFDPGTADGQFGSRTRWAISAWQEEHGGGEPTGFLTQEQVDALLEACKVTLSPLCTGRGGSPCWLETENQPGCHVWNDSPEHNRTVTWSGECAGGKASGQGRSVWRGSYGTESYEGGRRDGKVHGHGTATWADGTRYEGEWRDGKWHGHGTVTVPDGGRYEGEWRDGKKNGRGIHTWGQGSPWEGDRYEGEYRDNLMHGRGTYNWSDGRRYEGAWRDGKMHGRGTHSWASGDRYVGGMNNDQIHGQGVYTSSEGWRYEGEFRNGKRHGRGTYTSASGTSWTCQWVNGDHVKGTCTEH